MVLVYFNGFHGDLNETFFVGDRVENEKRKLVQVLLFLIQHLNSNKGYIRMP